MHLQPIQEVITLFWSLVCNWQRPVRQQSEGSAAWGLELCLKYATIVSLITEFSETLQERKRKIRQGVIVKGFLALS